MNIDGRTMRSKKTQKKILKNVKEIFIKNGFEKTTVTQIGKKANISYGSVYTHFDGKDDILIHLMQDIMKKFYQIAEMSYQPTNLQDAQEIIKHQVTLFLQLAQSEQDILRVFHEAIGFSQVVNEEWKKIRHSFITRIEKDIAYVQEKDLAKRSLDKKLIAKSWFFINEMFLWEIVNGNNTESIDVIASHIVQLYTTGLYKS